MRITPLRFLEQTAHLIFERSNILVAQIAMARNADYKRQRPKFLQSFQCHAVAHQRWSVWIMRADRRWSAPLRNSL
jgi:hypothetical protein